MAIIGVISDTHGLLRPAARAALAGVDRIIHAGDIDDAATMQWLTALGTTTFVRGNCDRGSWARNLPEHEIVTVEDTSIYVVHDVAQISIDPKAAGVSVVVSGHSHIPGNEVRDGILYFNPGSAGPRRWGKPVSIGKLHTCAGQVRGEIIILEASV